MTNTTTPAESGDREDDLLTFTRHELASAVIAGIRAALDIALDVATDLDSSQGDFDAAVERAYDVGVITTAGRLLLGPDAGKD